MTRLTTLKKGKQMEGYINYILLVATLLNLGLVILAISRLNSLRRDLHTPVVKKFNPDFKKRPVDVPKMQENPKKDFRPQNRNNGQQGQNRPNNPQGQGQGQSQGQGQGRPLPKLRRPAARAPEVFSNDVPDAPAASSAPPRPGAPDAANGSEGRPEGRRPLPPRFAPEQAAPAAPAAPAFSAPAAPPFSDDDAGVEIDRSKVTYGRRNAMKKSIVDDDDDSPSEGKSV